MDPGFLVESELLCPSPCAAVPHAARDERQALHAMGPISVSHRSILGDIFILPHSMCADNAYRLGAVRAVGHLCKTNMFSNTAFRGFGGPQVLLLPPPPASPCSV